MDKKCCGTCYWHKREGDDWICTNSNSDELADYTEYGFVCDCWEERG